MTSAQGAVRRLLPAFAAALLGLAVFGPGLREGATAFLGREHVDAWGTQWFYWYVGRQLGLKEPLGHTDLLFHPWGKEVYLHTGANVLDAVLAWPLRRALGPVVGYDVFVLLIVVTNGLAMRSLLREQVREPSAVALGALLFALNPFVLLELRDGRPTQALLAFVVLFWRDWLAMDDDRRPRRAVLAGLQLALAGLTYWYYALFCGIAAAVVALWRTARGPTRREVFVRHALAGGVALLAVAPFALPMMRAADVPGLLDVSTWTLASWTPTTREGTDIGVYVFDPRRWVSGFYARAAAGGLRFIAEDRTVLLTQVALGAAGLWAAPRGRRGALVALLAVGFAVAIGPSVDLGVDVPNVVYLGLVHGFRVFRRLWWPSRALLLAQLGLGVLAAWAFARAARRPAAGVAVGLVAVAAWGLELRRGGLLPLPTWSADIPAAYRCLGDAAEGAVIELPYAHTQAHLYYQTVHGRPIFGGMVEDNPVFAPAEQIAARTTNTFLAVLFDQADEAEAAPAYAEADRQAVHDLGYRWVVLDKRAFAGPRRGGPERLRRARRTFGDLLGAPVYEDDTTALFAPWGDASPCPGAARSLR